MSLRKNTEIKPLKNLGREHPSTAIKRKQEIQYRRLFLLEIIHAPRRSLRGFSILNISTTFPMDKNNI
jgi:hypothetical protein